MSVQGFSHWTYQPCISGWDVQQPPCLVVTPRGRRFQWCESAPETSENWSWLLGMVPIHIPSQSVSKAGNLAFLSGAGWWGLLLEFHQPVQVISSLCSFFQFFNWFWVPIKCNLTRILEGGIFRAGKQNACVCCWNNSERCWRPRKKILWEKRNLTSWRDKPSNLHLDIKGQIPTFRIYCIQGFLVLEGREKVHGILQWCQDVSPLSYMSSFHSFFLFYFCVWCWSSFNFLISSCSSFPWVQSLPGFRVIIISIWKCGVKMIK